jgi:molybdopterin adenylyltransferase
MGGVRRAGAGAPRRSRRSGAAHRHAAPAPRAVGCAVVTVSDTRARDADPSGDALERALVRAGHRVVARRWVRDQRAPLRRLVMTLLGRGDVDVVTVTGGTGIAPRDVTPEALRPLMQRELPGFGERFRAASARQVGSAAWLSRATAGVARGRLLILLPGSPRAVELAVEELLIPELAHAVRLLGRFARGE